jgi:hypothetical protein
MRSISLSFPGLQGEEPLVYCSASRDFFVDFVSQQLYEEVAVNEDLLHLIGGHDMSSKKHGVFLTLIYPKFSGLQDPCSSTNSAPWKRVIQHRGRETDNQGGKQDPW